jgi:hypothetical protein
MNEALESVLRLVAEGKLTAEEAAPLLDALDARGERQAGVAGDASDRPPSALRIEVREGGKQIVNLRLPLAVGRLAVDRVPGLTGEHATRIREALRHGVRGPIVEVDDADGDGVRIVLD